MPILYFARVVSCSSQYILLVIILPFIHLNLCGDGCDKLEERWLNPSSRSLLLYMLIEMLNIIITGGPTIEEIKKEKRLTSEDIVNDINSLTDIFADNFIAMMQSEVRKEVQIENLKVSRKKRDAHSNVQCSKEMIYIDGNTPHFQYYRSLRGCPVHNQGVIYKLEHLVSSMRSANEGKSKNKGRWRVVFIYKERSFVHGW